MKNKEIKDLTKKDTKINIDEVSPQELDQIAGGVNVEEEEEECIVFSSCGTFSTKLN